MVAALRQMVTVGPNGRVEIEQSPLKQGKRAEVVVFVEEPDSIARKLAALDKLEKSLDLDEAKVREWRCVVREEHEAFGPCE